MAKDEKEKSEEKKDAKASGRRSGGTSRRSGSKEAGSKGQGQSRSRSSKPERETEAVPLVVRASAKYVRVAPRKARLVANQVRGLGIDEARALLEFSPRGAARDIRKLLDSAASNAENNHDLVADDMRIREITVDEGPTLRRYRARALGRATRINKRTSHIAIALSPEE